MDSTKEIVLKLQELQKNKGYKNGDIVRLVKKNGGYVSLSTVKRVFKVGGENDTFSYEDTLRPIMDALLGVEEDDENEDEDEKSIKEVMRLKGDLIADLERKNLELIAENEKFKKDNEHNERHIAFLQEQLQYKDKRMDLYWEAICEKDARIKEFEKQILACPYRKRAETEKA